MATGVIRLSVLMQFTAPTAAIPVKKRHGRHIFWNSNFHEKILDIQRKRSASSKPAWLIPPIFCL
jgi:hypothetical protein